MSEEEIALSDIPGRERLGTLIRRYRDNAGKTLSEVAGATGIDEELLRKTEYFETPLDANQLQSLAAFLGVQWHPLLDVVRDFHKSVWESSGNKKGVQLDTMDMESSSLAAKIDGETERALIKAADDLLFMSNVCRETADRALASAVQLRALMSDRGIIEPDDAIRMIDDPKVSCSACGVIMDKNKESMVSYEPEDGETMYFGSRTCGDAWMNGEERVCKRSGLPIIRPAVQPE